MRSIITETVIDASPEEVWSVLTDIKRFSEWNPFIIEAEGEPDLGRRLELRILPPGESVRVFRPSVTVFEAPRVFEWLGRVPVPGVFDGRHRFELHRQDGLTRLVHSEEFTGALVPLLFSAIEEKTRAGFEAMNSALKTRVESAARTMP